MGLRVEQCPDMPCAEYRNPDPTQTFYGRIDHFQLLLFLDSTRGANDFKQVSLINLAGGMRKKELGGRPDKSFDLL